MNKPACPHTRSCQVHIYTFYDFLCTRQEEKEIWRREHKAIAPDLLLLPLSLLALLGGGVEGAMATILENIQKARFLPTRPPKDDLPTFQGVGGGGGGGKEESHLMGLRKRLSSFSGKIQPISSASAEWAFRRSKSAPSLAAFAGGPLKRWWDWGVGWLLSKKLGFASDLEMNEEEVAALGRQSRGTWGHVLYKVRSGVRRLVVSSHSLPTTQQKHSLPTTQKVQCKPAAFAYTQSFQYGRAMAH